MSVQVYSVPGQTERTGRPFWNGKNIDLLYELSLTCGGSVNYYKSVHHPIPTRENKKHPENFEINQ